MAVKRVDPIPEGYHSITPSLVYRAADRAIEFYVKAFGSEVTFRHDRPDGKVAHATIKIGDSIVMLGEECLPHPGHEGCPKPPEELKGTTSGLFLYVKDADAVFDRAIKAGAKAMMPVADMFWGDRMGALKDPFGYAWMIATHKEDVSEKELKQRAEDFYAKQAHERVCC